MPFNKKFGRPHGGNDRPFNKNNSFGPKELFDAECENCHKRCQVPFRPNGKKPVYCSDCFKREERPQQDRFEQRPYERRERPSGPGPASAPAPDRRIDDLKRQLDAVQATLEKLVSSIESGNRGDALSKEVRRHVSPAPTPAAKPASAPKKVEKAPAKAPTKAPANKPAKKAAKKTTKK
jgi:CxxC-x17-CxxC domain-containing protein